MRKFVGAVTLLVLSIGATQADEFFGVIKKIDGNTLTVIKGQKKGTPGEEVTLTATSDVKVLKGKYDKETKKLIAGDPIENGLQASIFASGTTRASITTNGDGKVTQIVVGGKKGKKKKNTTGDE